MAQANLTSLFIIFIQSKTVSREIQIIMIFVYIPLFVEVNILWN